MSSRLLTFAITAAIMLAGTLVVLREGWLSGWQMRIKEMMATSGPPYTPARFRIDLVDQVNYARTADRMAPLKVDPEMEAWLTKHYPTLDLADLDNAPVADRNVRLEQIAALAVGNVAAADHEVRGIGHGASSLVELCLV